MQCALRNPFLSHGEGRGRHHSCVPQSACAFPGARLTLLLAAIGCYEVLAHLVAQRTHEIGIRMALGARSGEVPRMVVVRGAKPVFIGVCFGTIAGLM